VAYFGDFSAMSSQPVKSRMIERRWGLVRSLWTAETVLYSPDKTWPQRSADHRGQVPVLSRLTTTQCFGELTILGILDMPFEYRKLVVSNDHVAQVIGFLTRPGHIAVQLVAPRPKEVVD
jgi:hypothetical protein